MSIDVLSPESAARLRADMVAAMQEKGRLRRPEVAAAFAKVPREVFGPEAKSLEAAYDAYDTIRTRFDETGRCTSSVSAPWLQADMIEMAGVREGDVVCEVGSGGYNAALLREIVGSAGRVVTVDIDPWVTGRARQFLDQTGYHDVEVVTGDADDAVDSLGPFDVIIVTVGARDCPWIKLLKPGGRLVVPIIFKSTTRAITFVRDGDRFVGHDPTVCGFVSMQGAGASRHHQVHLADRAVDLTIDGGPPLDPRALEDALYGERAVLWTDVTVAFGESFDSLNLWVLTRDDQFGLIHRDESKDCDLIDTTPLRWFCPALITPDSFAYLTSRQIGEKERRELGVVGHGPNGAALAEELRGHFQTWDRDHRSGPGPDFTLFPAHIAVPEPEVGRVFTGRHTHLVLTWPA